MFEISAKDIIPASHGRRRPLYRRIALTLEQAIDQRQLLPGDRLPTHQQLASQLGVTTLTISRAYRVLTAQGLITQRRKRGSFVARDAQHAAALLSSKQPHRVSQRSRKPRLRRITLCVGRRHLAKCHRDLVRLTTEMLQGLDASLKGRRVSYHYTDELTEASVGSLSYEQGDALLALRCDRIDRQVIEKLKAARVPVIKALNSGLQFDAPSLAFDVYQPVRLACEHLLECGYRKLGYIGPMGGEAIHPDEMIGVKFLEFTNVLARANLDFDMAHVRKASNRPGEAYEAAQKIIRQGDLPEAFFVETDYMAMEVIAALNQAGLSVPEDIGIASMDNVADAASFDPPLTTAATAQAKVGREAGRQLLAWYATGQPLENRMFTSRLHVRQSTAPMLPQPVLTGEDTW